MSRNPTGPRDHNRTHRFPRHNVPLVLLLVAGTHLACTEITSAPLDVLGAHLVGDRGCVACHASHSGANGNGAGTTDPTSGVTALWGEDVAGLYGKIIRTGGGKLVEMPPASSAATTPDVEGVLSCLSCHDGNLASRAMMQNRIYEQIPSTYGRVSQIPTLFDLSNLPGYLSNHPVGLSTTIACGGDDNWDCSASEGLILMRGARSTRFVENYGFFVKPGDYDNTPVVLCTTCHEPHAMNVVNVSASTRSGLPHGSYTTKFFLRGPYNPADPNTSTNQTAQFCRQCHGAYSNEMNGSTARTVF